MKRRVLPILLRSVIVAILCLALVSLRVRGTFSPSLPAVQAGGSPVAFGARGHRIEGRLYAGVGTNTQLPLVIVLHGDAPGRKPSYQYSFASALHRATGAPVLALLRPGYTDPFGGHSEGDRGLFAVGDNYTQAAQVSLADAIAEARQQLGASRVLLVGHSGGAVLTAVIAATRPGLVQTAVLVSCPCDVAAFRRHMARQQWNPLWLVPWPTVSPMATLPGISPEESVLAISGEHDPVALPSYAEDYVLAVNRQHPLQARFISLPGQGHEILLDPRVLQLVANEVQRNGSAN